MRERPKRKGKAFWSRVEDAGETMELGMRLLLGFLFAFLSSASAWWIGSHIWIGVSIVIALLALPFGFLIGFFWLEVKMLLQFFLRFWMG